METIKPRQHTAISSIVMEIINYGERYKRNNNKIARMKAAMIEVKNYMDKVIDLEECEKQAKQ